MRISRRRTSGAGGRPPPKGPEAGPPFFFFFFFFFPTRSPAGQPSNHIRPALTQALFWPPAPDRPPILASGSGPPGRPANSPRSAFRIGFAADACRQRVIRSRVQLGTNISQHPFLRGPLPLTKGRPQKFSGRPALVARGLPSTSGRPECSSIKSSGQTPRIAFPIKWSNRAPLFTLIHPSSSPPTPSAAPRSNSTPAFLHPSAPHSSLLMRRSPTDVRRRSTAATGRLHRPSKINLAFSRARPFNQVPGRPGAAFQRDDRARQAAKEIPPSVSRNRNL